MHPACGAGQPAALAARAHPCQQHGCTLALRTLCQMMQHPPPLALITPCTSFPSPQVSASVANHMQALPDLTHAVRFEVIADGSRDALTGAWKGWMEAASE